MNNIYVKEIGIDMIFDNSRDVVEGIMCLKE